MSSYRIELGSWSVVVGMMGVLVGCQGAPDKASTNPNTSATNAAERGLAAQGSGASPSTGDAPLDRIDEANFQLTWTLDPSAPETKGGSGRLVLVAKPPFKPNQDYPHKFKLRGSDVTLSAAEVTKADMQVSVDRVVAPVAFEVTGPKPTLEGTFAFSVCTAEACLIERKDIRLSVAPNGGASGAAAVGAAPTVTTDGK